jgi:hypothetical protein
MTCNFDESHVGGRKNVVKSLTDGLIPRQRFRRVSQMLSVFALTWTLTLAVLSNATVLASSKFFDAGGSHAFCVCNCYSTIFVDQSDCPGGFASVTVTVFCNGTQCGTETVARRCNLTVGVVVFCPNECGGKGHCWYPCDPKTWGTCGPNLTNLCHDCVQPGRTC